MTNSKAFKSASNNLSNSTINERCKGGEERRETSKEVMRILQMQSELTVEAGFEIHGGVIMMMMVIVEIVVAALDDVASSSSSVLRRIPATQEERRSREVF